MTAAQVQADTTKAQKWLARRGYTGRIWRSAWMQNSAPQAPTTNPMVLVNSMYGAEGNTERIDTFPFVRRHDLTRHALHSASLGTIDAWFAELQERHGCLVIYTHIVSDDGVSNTDASVWAYFLDKIDAGIAAGWLEGVTLESLMASTGLAIRQGFDGTIVAEWPDIDGTPDTVILT
jgi:hypothetical protein